MDTENLSKFSLDFFVVAIVRSAIKIAHAMVYQDLGALGGRGSVAQPDRAADF